MVALGRDAPRTVRRTLLDYADRLDPALLDDVRLLTSELVTNAVAHSGRPEGDPITVTLEIRPTAVHVDVGDGGRAGPLVPRSTHPPSGLGLVDALSDRWASRDDDGHHVWFEIDIDRGDLCHRSDRRRP